LQFGLAQDGRHPGKNNLSIAKGEEIDELPHRFRIGDRDTARSDDRQGGFPVSGMERNAGQFQHLKDIGEIQFAHQRKTDHVKLTEGVLGFQGKQGDFFLAENADVPARGKEAPLGMNVRNPVEKVVQNFDPGMTHPDLIRIGENKSDVDPIAPEFFSHRVDLFPGENLRIFDFQQQFAEIHAM
jgi:hypothetical protein